jgi:hypothetical protein
MNSINAKKIRASIILEVIGRPPEHLTETLEKLVAEIGEEKGVKIQEKRVNESVPLKEQPEFYTNFAEIELELESILNLIIILFKYMPAHVEIIEPESIELDNSGWNDTMNEIVRRLHGYDEIARVMQVEKSILEKKLKEVLDKK